MPANTSPVFSLTPHFGAATFVPADTTAKKSLFTATTNGSRIDGIWISTSDTSAENVAFYINDGSTDWYIGNVNVPIGSGYTTVARVDALGSLAPVALGALVLPSGYILKANMVATVTTAKQTDIGVMGSDF